LAKCFFVPSALQKLSDLSNLVLKWLTCNGNTAINTWCCCAVLSNGKSSYDV